MWFGSWDELLFRLMNDQQSPELFGAIGGGILPSVVPLYFCLLIQKTARVAKQTLGPLGYTVASGAGRRGRTCATWTVRDLRRCGDWTSCTSSGSHCRAPPFPFWAHRHGRWCLLWLCCWA